MRRGLGSSDPTRGPRMNRREFLSITAGAAVTGAFACVAHRQLVTPAAEPPVIDVPTFHASRRFVRTAFGRIAYVERGQGPAALFMHGLPLNGYQWRGALDRLSPLRRCIAPDAMGLGYSEIPDSQSLAPEDQADMVAALLDALGESAVDLVASDSGGAVAQIFVARHPGRVRTLLLTNCDAHDDSPPPALLPLIEASRAGVFADETLVPQLENKASARLATGLGGCCFTYPMRFSDETIECYLRPLVGSESRKRQLHAYNIGLAHNPLTAIESELRRSPALLRVVWGTGDTLFDSESPAWLDRTFPRSMGVRRIEGAKLFFPEEMPDVIADEARQLWSAAS